ncbi:hypothetical protein VPH35_025839 [Triticum aestivum]
MVGDQPKREEHIYGATTPGPEVVPRRLPRADPSALRQGARHGQAVRVPAGARMLDPFLPGEHKEAESEGQCRDGRHGHGHHLVSTGPVRAPMASGVPSPGAGAGAGDEAHAPHRMPDTHEGHSARLHRQRGGRRSRQDACRRDPGRWPAGPDGVAPEPSRGLVRRGGLEGRARVLVPEPQLQVRGRLRHGSCGGGDERLAAVRRVRQRLRVGQAGGRPERRGEQARRDGHGVRGRWRERRHGAGGVPRP